VKNLLKILIASISFCLFTFAFLLPLNPPNGTWYQQFFPNLGGRTIKDITFVDSLTGYAVTPYISNDTSLILKTTNKGDNWSIIYRLPVNAGGGFSRVTFLNRDTGFVGGNALLKTTNGGMSWTPLNIPAINSAREIHVLSEDTIYFADEIDLFGGLFRTTDKGSSWERIYGGTANNPQRIYMYNARIGFMYTSPAGPLWKTTNSGYNWFSLPGGVYKDMHFVDSLTGWKANGDMKKTTDGGLNWTTQVMPYGGIIFTSGIQSFSFLSSDTIWGSGGSLFYGGGRVRGTLYRTTNGAKSGYSKLLIHLSELEVFIRFSF
jgi:photosystem II stability/assembly factor-like uncharacterized protein